MTTTEDYQAHFERLAAYEALEANARPRNKAALFDGLAAACICRVVVFFDGSGDSGQIESVDSFSADDNPMVFPDGKIALSEVTWEGPASVTVERTLFEAVEHIAYDLLSQTHGGWGNDDGAYGEFTFDVGQRSIQLDYNERHVSSENYQHEF